MINDKSRAFLLNLCNNHKMFEGKQRVVQMTMLHDFTLIKESPPEYLPGSGKDKVMINNHICT